MNTLKINGTTLTGIYVDAAVSFNKPAKRVSEYSIPGRNGNLVIDEGTFDNVLISYPVYEKNTFPTEFDNLVNWLASLEGYQRIECSNDPQHYRLGRFVVPETPTAKRLNKDGYYTLVFDCKPQRYLLTGEVDTEYDANPSTEYQGAIAEIEAIAQDVISDLNVAITPVQSGSGDPYPAGGGKNKINAPDTTLSSVGYVFNLTGLNLPAGIYTLSLNKSVSSTPSFAVSGPNGDYINTTIAFPYTFEVTGVITSMRLYSSAGTYTNIQLEAGSTATAYAPYSNIRPITGWTGAKVYRTGVNVWDEEWEVGGYSSSTGDKSPNNNTIRSKNYISCQPNTDYYFYNGKSGIGQGWYVFYYDASKTYVGNSGGWSVNGVKTTPTKAHYMTFQSNSAYGTTYNNDISINYPSTDHDYHAYNGNTYLTDWTSEAGTVYGGTLDVKTGELTVTHGYASIDGTENIQWSALQPSNTNYKAFYISKSAWASRFGGSPKNVSAGGTLNAICNEFQVLPQVYATNISASGVYGWTDNSAAMLIVPPSGVTSGFNTWLQSNPFAICYELATPTTVQLTAEEVSLLVGTNNIWADCGDVDVVVISPITLTNPTYFTSKPRIRVYGAGTFTVGDISITVAAHTQPYIDIDSETETCEYNGTNMSSYVTLSSNDFPVFKAGANYVVMGSGITKLVITPRWWIL